MVFKLFCWVKRIKPWTFASSPVVSILLNAAILISCESFYVEQSLKLLEQPKSNILTKEWFSVFPQFHSMYIPAFLAALWGFFDRQLESIGINSWSCGKSWMDVNQTWVVHWPFWLSLMCWRQYSIYLKLSPIISASKIKDKRKEKKSAECRPIGSLSHQWTGHIMEIKR